MRQNAKIFLISVVASNSDTGDTIVTPTKRPVLAEKKSIRQSEFYQAAATGLQPELTFIVWSREYSQERTLEFNDKDYNIIRAYDRADERTELVCQGLVNK